MRQICEAVSAVHVAGLQHGDIHAENIVVDASARPRLIDLGCAVMTKNAKARRADRLAVMKLAISDFTSMEEWDACSTFGRALARLRADKRALLATPDWLAFWTEWVATGTRLQTVDDSKASSKSPVETAIPVRVIPVRVQMHSARATTPKTIASSKEAADREDENDADNANDPRVQKVVAASCT